MSLSARDLEEAKAELRTAISAGQVITMTQRTRVTTHAESRSNAAAAKRCRDKRRANGLCPSCGGATEPGRVNCAKCLAVVKAASAIRRKRFAHDGLCTNCGAPRDRRNQRNGKPARQCSKCHASNSDAKQRQKQR